MRLFFALITFVILTACSSQPEVIATGFAEVTITLPPTLTATTTPEPTSTPLPPTPTTYTPEMWAGMDKTARLEVYNNAPAIEGYEKVKSLNDRHALYRNEQTGKIDTARNLLTGEVFPIIEISMDPNKPLIITYDNLTSGLLARSEKAMCPGFSKEVIPGDWFYAKGDTIFSAVQMRPDSRYSDPSKRPQKMCSYSEVVTDLGSGEKPYIVMGVANKNKDGSVGFFHGWASSEDFPKFLKILDNKFIIITNQIRNDPGYPEKEFLDKTRPDVENWAEQLESTDVFPKEFELELFTLGAIDW